MNHRFITVIGLLSSMDFYIDYLSIEAILPGEEGSIIIIDSGKEINVKESPEEVLHLIESKCNNR